LGPSECSIPHSEFHELPQRIHALPLLPESIELNPVEVIGAVDKECTANTLWHKPEDFEGSAGWVPSARISVSVKRVRGLDYTHGSSNS